MNNNFTFIDLFAGIGGCSLALQNIGGTAVFVSELDRAAQEIYKQNFKQIPVGDITLIDESTIPDHDILIAGFPCQSFSQAGSKLGSQDTRDSFFYDIKRILKEKKPKAFILETFSSNNKNLISIVKTLEELNYYVPTPEVLNAYNFGVPQNKKRLIIVGFNKNFIHNNEISFEYPTLLTNPSYMVSDILDDTVEEKYTLSDEIYSKYINNRFLKNNFINSHSKYTPALRHTIFLEQDGKNARVLTYREYARLQGFPEEFILRNVNRTTYKLLAGASTVPMIQAVATQVLNYLNSQTSKSSMSTEKQKLIDLFHLHVKGKVPDLTGFNKNHDGKKGHWLERQFGISANAKNEADIFGYELKDETKSKISFGDWRANRYIYKHGPYTHLFESNGDTQPLRQDEFCRIFGKPNEEKEGRCSWSGEPCPKINEYNKFGQILLIEENLDIVALYSYSKDQRPDKNIIVPRELQQENLLLAKWFGTSSPSDKKVDKCLKAKLEEKFNDKGWFTCKTDSNGIYNKICFGKPMNYENWLELVVAKKIYLDSGMHQGNKRPYSQWRASNKLWNDLITDSYE